MIDKIITNIYKGISVVIKTFLCVVLLYLFSYLLSYVSEANTREIFIRLIFMLLGLKFLYNLGK